jgi:hypothetical protein
LAISNRLPAGRQVGKVLGKEKLGESLYGCSPRPLRPRLRTLREIFAGKPVRRKDM